MTSPNFMARFRGRGNLIGKTGIIGPKNEPIKIGGLSERRIIKKSSLL